GETRFSKEKAERIRTWDRLTKAFEGKETVIGIITGKVKGGFTVDIGNVRAFLPGSLVDVRPVRDTAYLEGKPLEFKVIKLDRLRNNVVVSRREVLEAEYSAERDMLLEKLQEGAILRGVVKNLVEYGAFVEIEPGVEGLVHVSEMDWTNKNVNPGKLVHLGDEVEVMILDIDEERRRISLGMKQCVPNPWEEFSQNFQKGDKVKGQIKSITDFGIFIGLDGGIDGLVHLSDLDWNEPGETAVRRYSKGQELEATVLAIDGSRERISLGIKQMGQDPLTMFLADNQKGQMVKGTVKEVDAKGAVITLAGGVEGYIKAGDLARDRVDDATKVLSVGQELESRFIGVDRKNRIVTLSVRAKEIQEEEEAVAEYSRNASTGKTSLGDLLKEQIGGND
ncbi:MAG: 30S ribosomal protein S1, partial [Gammaproteobacteria bacterium]|nr:30S ribosomal protein S1 [Gammaproteobacteria bacterium]